MKVVIIDYGAGNIKSIQFAFQRLGIEALTSNNTDVIKGADRIIFPGVDEASSAMKELTNSGLDKLIPNLKQPVLGICLGMQLMCTKTEEGKTKGLGIFNTKVKQFTNAVKVPQMGWNTIHNLKTNLFNNIKEAEYMYLVHSYYADNCQQTIATSKYELSYSTGLHKNNFYGVQFHPEKSQSDGLKVLGAFVELPSNDPATV